MHLMKYFAQSNRLVLNGAKGGSNEDSICKCIHRFIMVYHIMLLFVCVCVFQYCKDLLSFKFTCFPKIHTKSQAS